MRITWRQALAWRMQRQLLEPVGNLSVARVVGRLCGVQAQVDSSAELAVRVRRERSRPGEVARALESGVLIKTWAMRGALHLLTPERGGAVLSLMAATRLWERPSWQRYFGVKTTDWELIRDATRDALDGAVLTRDELVARLVQRPALAHLGDAFGSSWGTLFKPLAWQGELCMGPKQGTRVTFRRPHDASSRWAGVPEPAEAAPMAIVDYLGAYGPATMRAFAGWMAGGWFGTRKLRAWFGELGDQVFEVDVDGERAFVLSKDADELASTKPTNAVRLLPGFDQWVLGPGTVDAHVVPTARRSLVSRQSGWISPLVIVGGVVSGTWVLDDDEVRIGWFTEAGRPPRKALGVEVERMSSILGRHVRPSVTLG